MSWTSLLPQTHRLFGIRLVLTLVPGFWLWFYLLLPLAAPMPSSDREAWLHCFDFLPPGHIWIVID
jgi:hypothetical protein